MDIGGLLAMTPAALPLVGPLLQQQGARETNAANASMAREQMQFQERMSSSAHQREVQDLTAAGLNPILSVNAGASTPAGASAQMQNPNEGMATTALEMANLAASLQKQKSEMSLMKAQENKAKMETSVIRTGLPKAELTNDVYDMVRPLVKKVKEGWMQNSPSRGMSEKEADAWLKSQRNLNLKKP